MKNTMNLTFIYCFWDKSHRSLEENLPDNHQQQYNVDYDDAAIIILFDFSGEARKKVIFP